MGVLQRVVGLVGVLHSAEVGARTGVYLASCEPVTHITGKYFLHDGKPAKSKAVTYDRDVAARLWTESERLCGLSFGIVAAA